MTTETTSTLARRAALIIEENGHAKGSYLYMSGRCCILGATYLAAANLTPQELLEQYGEYIVANENFEATIRETTAFGENEEVYLNLCYAIRDKVNQPTTSWNDRATKARVLEVLNEIAEENR